MEDGAPLVRADGALTTEEARAGGGTVCSQTVWLDARNEHGLASKPWHPQVQGCRQSRQAGPAGPSEREWPGRLADPKSKKPWRPRSYGLGGRRETFRFFPRLSETFRFFPQLSISFRPVPPLSGAVRPPRGSRSDLAALLRANALPVLLALPEKSRPKAGKALAHMELRTRGPSRNFAVLSETFRNFPFLSESFRRLPCLAGAAARGCSAHPGQ